MFSRLFKKPKLEVDAPPRAALDKSNETLEMLQIRENDFTEKASQEDEKAKEFTAAKDKRAAIRCLKRKRLYEQQIEQLGNFQLQIHDQVIMMEGAEAATETVDALRTGAAAMEAMNADHVDNIIDEIDEQREAMKHVQEAVSACSGAVAVFDEATIFTDELETELEELEGAVLEEQLLPPTETASAVPFFVPAGLLPAPLFLRRQPGRMNRKALSWKNSSSCSPQ